MSENFVETVSPQLSVPVTRNPEDVVAFSGDGVDQSFVKLGPVTIAFAGDDEE